MISLFAFIAMMYLLMGLKLSLQEWVWHSFWSKKAKHGTLPERLASASYFQLIHDAGGLPRVMIRQTLLWPRIFKKGVMFP